MRYCPGSLPEIEGLRVASRRQDKPDSPVNSATLFQQRIHPIVSAGKACKDNGKCYDIATVGKCLEGHRAAGLEALHGAVVKGNIDQTPDGQTGAKLLRRASVAFIELEADARGKRETEGQNEGTIDTILPGAQLDSQCALARLVVQLGLRQGAVLDRLNFALRGELAIDGPSAVGFAQRAGTAGQAHLLADGRRGQSGGRNESERRNDVGFGGGMHWVVHHLGRGRRQSAAAVDYGNRAFAEGNYLEANIEAGPGFVIGDARAKLTAIGEPERGAVGQVQRESGIEHEGIASGRHAGDRESIAASQALG